MQNIITEASQTLLSTEGHHLHTHIEAQTSCLDRQHTGLWDAARESRFLSRLTCETEVKLHFKPLERVQQERICPRRGPRWRESPVWRFPGCFLLSTGLFSIVFLCWFGEGEAPSSVSFCPRLQQTARDRFRCECIVGERPTK